jgi:hypothetical protein
MTKTLWKSAWSFARRLAKNESTFAGYSAFLVRAKRAAETCECPIILSAALTLRDRGF